MRRARVTVLAIHAGFAFLEVGAARVELVGQRCDCVAAGPASATRSRRPWKPTYRRCSCCGLRALTGIGNMTKEHGPSIRRVLKRGIEVLRLLRTHEGTELRDPARSHRPAEVDAAVHPPHPRARWSGVAVDVRRALAARSRLGAAPTPSPSPTSAWPRLPRRSWWRCSAAAVALAFCSCIGTSPWSSPRVRGACPGLAMNARYHIGYRVDLFLSWRPGGPGSHTARRPSARRCRHFRAHPPANPRARPRSATRSADPGADPAPGLCGA